MSGFRRTLLPVVLLGLSLLASWSALAAATPGRFALVIGNGAYQSVTRLLNPPADATAVAKALRAVGFDVTDGTNLNRADFVDRLRTFSRKVADADVALVYYAGHGVQVDSENWLLPTDARLRDRLDLQFEAISTTSLLQGLAAARTRIIVLDACRNNPFKEGFLSTSANRAVSRGLAPLQAADSGTLIAYATSPGAVAADGTGENGPFARALADAITKPGLEVRQLFTRVRQEVVSETQGTQTPWENSSLLDDVYLNGRPTPPPAPAPPPLDARELELTYWKTVQATTDPGDLATFLKKFPNGTFAALAQTRLNRLTAPQRPVQTTFQDCPECPSMITIPSGSFRFGAADDDPEKKPEEGPARDVAVKAFAMGRFDVTFDDWAACRGAGGCRSDPSGENGHGRQPVVNVTYADALDYVAWLSKKTGHAYRLPSETEWEYAARGGTTTPRFWGDPAKACIYANVFDRSAAKTVKFVVPEHPCNDGYVFTSPVGSFKPNPFGLYDMLGNVWQWMADCWSDHNGEGLAQVAGPPSACAEHGLRGGSWMSDPARARVSARLRSNVDDADTNIGFRVVRDPP